MNRFEEKILEPGTLKRAVQVPEKIQTLYAEAKNNPDALADANRLFKIWFSIIPNGASYLDPETGEWYWKLGLSSEDIIPREHLN